MGGVKKKFIIDGKAYQTQLKTEILARFMKGEELATFMGRYNAALHRKTGKDKFVPTDEDMALWQRYMDGTASQYELAKETGKSSAAVMWLMAKVSRYALGKK